MVNLNISEKRIIFRIMNLIMKADCVIHPAEVEFLDKVFNEFELDYDEFDHMEDIELDELTKEFSTLLDDKKEYAKRLFIEMSECDGYVDKRESDLINRVIQGLKNIK